MEETKEKSLHEVTLNLNKIKIPCEKRSCILMCIASDWGVGKNTEFVWWTLKVQCEDTCVPETHIILKYKLIIKCGSVTDTPAAVIYVRSPWLVSGSEVPSCSWSEMSPGCMQKHPWELRMLSCWLSWSRYCWGCHQGLAMWMLPLSVSKTMVISCRIFFRNYFFMYTCAYV